MLTDKKISSQENSTTSRRRFLGNSLKLTALSAFLLPMKKVLGTGSSFLISHTNFLYARNPVILQKLWQRYKEHGKK